MNWTKWALFPDPRRQEFISAPFGPGVYELRVGDTECLVLVGCGKNVAQRMTSLLPAPHGQGTRKNAAKRAYVLKHLGKIEYRCCATKTTDQAKSLERKHRTEYCYLFPT